MECVVHIKSVLKHYYYWRCKERQKQAGASYKPQPTWRGIAQSEVR